jgi:hypothetical protein
MHTPHECLANEARVEGSTLAQGLRGQDCGGLASSPNL